MNTGERLAAYVAGELDADERRALERELARDPDLRSRLARLRRADELLTSLPDVAPRPGFSSRLHAAVQDELDRLPVAAGGDELATRRTRRWGTRSWMPALAGAAAALVGVVVVVAGVTTLGGGEDDSAGADDVAMDTLEEATDEDTAASMAAGPVVAATGNEYDADAVRDLAARPEFGELLDRDLTREEAAELVTSYALAFDGGADASLSAPTAESMQDAGAAGTEDETTDGGEAADGDDAAPPAPAEGRVGAPLQFSGDVDPEQVEVARQCLPPLLEAADPRPIPVYAELASFDSEPVVIYGLVTVDPATDRYTRLELWVVGREDCEVRLLAPADR